MATRQCQVKQCQVKPRGWRHQLGLKMAALAIVGLAVSGCSGSESGNIFDDSFWASSPLRENDEAELGIAELTKGNFVAAEGHFQRALKANPKDVDALLGAGILYQNTGQLTKAREMYEAVLAIRPDESQQFIVLNNLQTQPASQLASVNLSLIDTGGVTSSLQLGRAGNDPVTGQAVGGISSAPQSAALLGRSSGATVPTQPGGFLPDASGLPGQQDVQPLGLSGAPQVNEGSLSRFSQAERNKVSRFATIKALRDQGLITQQEYLARRQANVGALLPLTSPQPAAGLDRPVPTTDQISNRLRAIGRALEQRAISVSQHASERSLILTALLPEAPVRLAPPAVPPRGLIKAADEVAKLEQLRDGGFISSDEYARERQAIEAALQPKEPTPPGAQAPVTLSKDGKPAASSGPAVGVHLASYRSIKQANAGWKTIQRRHKSLLDGMNSEVKKVDLGKKGTFYRLIAGPVESKAAQRQLCTDLKRRRQFCEASTFGG